MRPPAKASLPRRDVDALGEQLQLAAAQIEGAEDGRLFNGASQFQIAREFRIDAAPAHEDAVGGGEGEIEKGVEIAFLARLFPGFSLQRQHLRGKTLCVDMVRIGQRFQIGRDAVRHAHLHGDEIDLAADLRRPRQRTGHSDVEIGGGGDHVGRGEQRILAGDADMPGMPASGATATLPAMAMSAAVLRLGGEAGMVSSRPRPSMRPAMSVSATPFSGSVKAPPESVAPPARIGAVAGPVTRMSTAALPATVCPPAASMELASAASSRPFTARSSPPAPSIGAEPRHFQFARRPQRDIGVEAGALACEPPAGGGVQGGKAGAARPAARRPSKASPSSRPRAPRSSR